MNGLRTRGSLGPASRRHWPVASLRLNRTLLGATQGRSVSLFSGGEGLNPLLLHKAPFPVPQVYTAFVSSHNGCESNPISEYRPEAI